MIAGEHRLALPAGYQLGKYRFKEVLGAGGFGITYLADDDSLGRRVAIKELLPNDIATRLDGSTVVAKTKSEEGNLAWARDRFLQEGRALAACEHPNVVHVYEMVEANGTAYMVTKFEEGRSFAEWLKEIDGPPKESELRTILMPLLSGLERVHRAGFLHRDLKPENIYITDDGRPILLDFGSARQAVSDRTTSLTSIVTSGYAPFEQYHEDGKQGAWTDIYAMGAVMYRAIHGKKPPEATRRLQNDPCLKLAREYAGKYSAPFLSGIDKALSVEPTKRPQNTAEWRQLLGDAPAEQKIVADPVLVRQVAVAQTWIRENPLMAAGAAAVLLILSVAAWKVFEPSPAPTRQIAATTLEPTPPVTVTPEPAPAVSQPPPVAVVPPAPPLPPPVVETPVQKTADVEPPRKVDPQPPADPAETRKGPRVGEKWTNSLGQVFAWVPGLPMHMAVWETRRGDFEAFVRATGYDATAGALSLTTKGWKATGATWINPGFPQTPTHPVVGVNAYDALEFCRWLTEKDRAAGLIDDRLAYRLPTDGEWRSASQDWKYPWGESWPPNVGAGNYAGEEMKTTLGSKQMISGYRDGYTGTSPVATFQGNAAGFFDLGGNAAEICGSWLPPGAIPGMGNDPKDAGPMLVLRGGSWVTSKPEALQLELRDCVQPQERYLTVGFRCILAPVSEKEAFVLPALRMASQDLPSGVVPANGEVVEKRLVGTWESKTTTPAGTVTWRWVQEADGGYALAGPFPDAGHVTASGGRIQQVSDTTGIKSTITYRFKTTTQMTTNGPLGEATWRKVASAAKPATVASDDTSDNGSGDRPTGSKPAPKPQYNKPTQRNIENRAKDLGNSLRRKFGF